MTQLIDLGKLRFHFAGDWNNSTTYESNDIVKYGGNVYVYTYGLKTSGNLPTNSAYWALMVEGFLFKGEFDVATSYRIGDGVAHGGKVYICILDTTGNTPPNTTYWSQFADGIQWEGDYSGTKNYQKNDVVTYGGSVYIAKVDTTGNLPSSAAHWARFVEGISAQGVYNAATDYVVGDLVAYGPNLYRALGDTTGNIPTDTNHWEVLVSGTKFHGAYSAGTTYYTNDLVSYGNNLYRSKQEQVGNIPTTATWELISSGVAFQGVYANATTYYIGDIVTYGSNAYIALQQTVGNLPTDTANWTQYSSGFSYQGVWSSATNYYIGQVVSYGGSIFQAKADNSNVNPTTTATWDKLVYGYKNRGNWSTATQYGIDEVVTYGGNTYISLVPHASTTFATDLAAGNWQKFNSGIRWRGTWAASTNYLTDDIIKSGVSVYIATEDHTSSESLSTDIADGKITEFAKGGDYVLPDASDGGENSFMSSDGVNYQWREVDLTKKLVRIMRGSQQNTSANFVGTIKPGETWTVVVDANTAIPAKNTYIYFDSAYEGYNGNITQTIVTPEGGTTPAGISLSVGADTADTGWGNSRIYGTPTAEGTTIWKINYNDYYDDFDVFYKLVVAPAGTTPQWSSTVLPKTIIRNTVGNFTLSAAPTTTYANATFSLKDVSGFVFGVVPAINTSTGEVYLAGVGDIVSDGGVHSFTVVADLGEYGQMEQAFSGNCRYGDPFDAVYFGPGSAMTNPVTYQTPENGTAYLTVSQFSALWNPQISAGALRRRTNSRYSTSPYRYNEQYGLVYTEGWSYSSGTNGYLGPKCSSNTNTGTNGGVVKFYWTVPSGVTQISVVAVGAGSMGSYSWASDAGGGGGLAWVNAVTVTPGEVFEIAVGLGRRTESGPSSYWSGSTWMRRVNDIGYGADEFIVIGYGGGYQNGHPAPLNGRTNPQPSNLYFVEQYSYNNSRDPGSAAASTRYGTYGAYYGGRATSRAGGGAAGYQGHGGQGDSTQGSGGSAGSGTEYSSTYGVSAGGGVGLDGQGSGGVDLNGSGYHGTQGSYTSNYETDGTNSYYYAGGGGSGGSRGCYGENPNTSNGGVQNNYINGGMHGGGGGGSGTSWGGGAGGMGGIRIIWGTAADGTQRAFPNIYTTEDRTIADSMNVDGL
jgi:hypothetical protein